MKKGGRGMGLGKVVKERGGQHNTLGVEQDTSVIYVDEKKKILYFYDPKWII